MNAISQWWQDATFYHIYPLGLCGAPLQNDFKTVNRLEALYPWLDQMQALGMDSLYLGPIFQSTSHGYDTMDYYRIDIILFVYLMKHTEHRQIPAQNLKKLRKVYLPHSALRNI